MFPEPLYSEVIHVYSFTVAAQEQKEPHAQPISIQSQWLGVEQYKL